MSLFTGKTAWFAADVSQEIKHLWFTNGGQVETLSKADFIFAQRFDPEILLLSSTKSNHLSHNQANNQANSSFSQHRNKYPASLFRSDMITEAVAKGGIEKVPGPGHYQLLPDEIINALAKRF